MQSIQMVFKKYFLSFLIIFMIPVTFIIATLFSIGYDIFAKELREKDSTTINLSIASLNNELEDCIFIANNLITKDHFQKFTLSESPSEGVRLILTLFNYLSSNHFIHDAIVQFENDSYVYSSTTSMPIDDFYSNYTSSTYSASSLKNIINNVSEPLFIDSLFYEDTEYFALIVPLASYYEQIGSIIFLFNPSEFYTSLFTDIDSTRTFHFLDSHKLNESFSSIDLSYLSTFDDAALIQNLSDLPHMQGAFLSDINNYAIYACRPSPYISNLILLSTISHEEVFKPLHILLYIMFGSILVAFIFSLICSYYMAKHNYAPVEEMSYSLTTLKKGYRDLEDEMHKNIPIRQYFLLNQLVNGNITNILDFTQNCRELGVDLNAPYHGIMLIKTQSSSFTLDQTILDTIEGIQKTKLLYHYIIQHIHSHIDIYLVGTNSDIALPSLTLPEAELYFGSFSQRLSHIPQSYIDARTLSEFEKGNTEASSSVEVLFQDYKASLRQLSTYLQVKDFKEISPLIFKLLDSLEVNTLPFPLQKVICIEMIMIFNNYIDKQDELIPYEKLDLISLFKVESFEALKEIILEVSSEMLELIIHYHDALILEPSITLIKDLIKSHFDEEGLGAEQLALHFNITSTYLEEYFYKQTKMTLNDYITQIRLKQAEPLLRTTPYSLKIIANQVGFSHVSSFISHFKEHYHCTPGQYRNQFH